MATIVVDARLEEQILDEYESWTRLEEVPIRMLPPRGGPDARNKITLSGLDDDFLKLLKQKGVAFTVV